jgi:putative transposase
MLCEGVSEKDVAERLRVSLMSVNRWHRTLSSGGSEALMSRGPGGARCKLDQAQLRELETVLEAGPAAAGWQEDQRWTLARIAQVIRERFGVSYTLAGVSVLLRRVAWSVQVPSRQASERDEDAIAAWKKDQWPPVKERQRTTRRGCASRTKPAKA